MSNVPATIERIIESCREDPDFADPNRYHYWTFGVDAYSKIPSGMYDPDGKLFGLAVSKVRHEDPNAIRLTGYRKE